MKSHLITLSACVLGVAFASTARADISGTTFFDGNNNGLMDPTEIGLSGLAVRAYDASGGLAGTTTTGVSGAYTLTGLSLAAPYRVEFEGVLGSYPSAVGGGSASKVQFVVDGATAVDCGFYMPGQVMADLNPRYVASCDASAATVSVASWLTSQLKPRTTTTPVIHPHSDDMLSSQVGVPLSFAQKPGTKLLTMTPLASPSTANFGPGPSGPSAIYIADYSGVDSAFVSRKLLVALSSIGVDVTAQFPIGTLQPRTGEYGLAGAEYSKDGNELYLINMGNGKILKIDVSALDYALLPATAPTAGDITEITIPTSVSAALGRYRPTTLNLYGEDLYVGGVDDLTGEVKVLAMNVDTQVFRQVFNMPLNFDVGLGINGGGRPQGGWTAGPDNTNLTTGIFQPFVTNVVFDDTGSMIIGVTNRMVYNQNSSSQPGYVVRTWREEDGTYTLENNKISGPFTSTAVNSNVAGDGPGGGWFFQNGVVYNAGYTSATHTYLYSGGLLAIPGSNEIVGGYIDPIYINQFGARHMDWTNGRITQGIGLGGAKTFAIVGVGAVSDPGPIEIGNRVWKDLDGNGRQDAGEPGIANVTVELLDATSAVLETATTDADGAYIFSSDALRAASSTTSHRYGISGLSWGTDYFVRIPNATGGSQQTALSGFSLALANAAGDQRDSDGTASVDASLVAVSTGAIGENSHDFDFGFIDVAPAPPACEVLTANVLAQSCDDNGTPTDPADDFYLADITVDFLNPPATGTLDLTGPALHPSNTVSSVAVGSTTSATSHTFIGVRLIANNAASTLTAAFSAEPGCAYNFATPKVQACSNPPCSITALSAPVGECSSANTAGNPADDFYYSNVTVTFSGAPLSGYLELTGDALVTPNTVTIMPVSNLDGPTSHTFYNVRFVADAAVHNLTATFTADPACTLSVPIAAVDPCSGITAINLTAGPCNDNGTPADGADDYYLADVTVEFLSRPLSGNLTLTGPAMHASVSTRTVTYNAIPVGATSYIFTAVKLKANGLANNLTATFTQDPAFPFTVQAPAVDECVEVCPAITVTPDPLSSGTVGTAYSASPVAIGGTAPYTWTATGLPAGLSIDSGTGVISGTPTATGSATITATDANACEATTSLTVNPFSCPVITVTPDPLPDGTVGTAYSASPTASGAGGSASYTWSATGLPAGLLLNTSTGGLSGVPTEDGVATVVATFTGPGGEQCQGSSTFTVQPFCCPPISVVVP
ncbi:MAG: putative Ig domain-containing protein [Verrucomicrobiales bacterium]|nr:putative Ig domain-containing protein [Verrucomicrobiales bacterium]